MRLKHFNFLSLLFLLLLLFYTNVFAVSLEISNIDKKNLNDISIEFNNVLEFKSFVLHGNDLIIPYYTSNEKKYYYFSVLDRSFRNGLINEIKSGKIDYKTSLNENDIEYKINKFIILKEPKTVQAFVSVIFNDKIETNCSILNGKYGLWVAWPSKKQNDRWVKLFNIKNKDLKEKIEQEILQQYTLKNKLKTTDKK